MLGDISLNGRATESSRIMSNARSINNKAQKLDFSAPPKMAFAAFEDNEEFFGVDDLDISPTLYVPHDLETSSSTTFPYLALDPLRMYHWAEPFHCSTDSF